LAAQPFATAADLLRRRKNEKYAAAMAFSEMKAFIFSLDLVDAIPRCCHAGTYGVRRHSTLLTRPDVAKKRRGQHGLPSSLVW